MQIPHPYDDHDDDKTAVGIRLAIMLKAISDRKHIAAPHPGEGGFRRPSASKATASHEADTQKEPSGRTAPSCLT